MPQDVTKHLEFIQAIVARMAGNSFLLKTWSVTVTVALFALAAKDANGLSALLGLFPAASFWGLDAYYLRQERLFRRLYDDVRCADARPHAAAGDFSLSTVEYGNAVPGWFKTLWTPPLVGFHVPVIGAVLTVAMLFRT